MARIKGLKGGKTNITVSYGGKSATFSNFTVNKKTVTFSAPTLRSVSKYNGNGQALINSGSCTTGGTMYYYVSTSSSTPTFNTGSWTTTVPSKTNAGTYYLWYYVYVSDTGVYTGTGINTVTKVGNGSVTIPKADNSITVTSTSATIYVHSSHTYNNTTQLSVSGAKGSVTYSSSDTGKATVNSSGLVTSKSAGTVTITATDAGNTNYKSSTASCTVKVVTDTYTDTWNNPSISKYSYSNIGAGGGTSTPTVTVTQSGTRTWTSGYSSQSLSNSTFNYSYSMTTGNGFSINTTNGNITADSRGTTTGSERSSNTATVTVTGSGSKSSSKTATCTQAANTVGSYYDTGAIDYGTPSKVTFSGSTNESRCAGGNTTLSATVTDTYHTRRDYTSGSYDTSTRTASGSVGYEFVSRTCNDGSTATSYWGISGSTLTHRSMGTNWVTDECIVRAYNAGSSTIKGSNSDTLYASNVRSEVNITYYASCSIGDGITAAGGSATVSYSGYHTANYKYASGVTDTSLHTTEGDGASIAITSQTCAGGTNRFSLSGSKLNHSSMTTYAGTDSVIITATNSSNTSTISTAEKSITNELGTQKYKNTSGTTGYNIVYTVPTVSIRSELSAAGGTATVTCSVTNNTNWYQKYTSGTYTSQKTSTETGTARWMITSNGNSRFSHPSSGGTSLSGVGTVYNTGTKISHSNMTTNATTDTVTVTAYNIGDISKTKTASASVSNALTGISISLGSNPINYNTTTTATVTATYTSGSSKDVTSSLSTSSSATSNYIKSGNTSVVTVS